MNGMRLLKGKPAKVIIAVLVVGLLAAGGFAAWQYMLRSDDTPLEPDAAIVESGTKALMEDDVESLQDSAARVKQIYDYETVPEYVYIVARAEALQGNTTEAKRLVDIFRGFDSDATYTGDLENVSHADMLKQLEVDLASSKAIEESNMNAQLSPGGGAAGREGEGGL